MSIHTVEVTLSLLRSCPHFAKQALYLLNELEKNCLAEKDVDPGVENRVKGGKSYCSKIRVFVQPRLHWSFIKLVQKHLSLQGQNTEVVKSTNALQLWMLMYILYTQKEIP